MLNRAYHSRSPASTLFTHFACSCFIFSTFIKIYAFTNVFNAVNFHTTQPMKTIFISLRSSQSVSLSLFFSAFSLLFFNFIMI